MLAVALTLLVPGVSRRETAAALQEGARGGGSLTENQFYWQEKEWILAKRDDPDVFSFAGATTTARRPRLVLTMSEGTRPWFDNITREKLHGYANRTNSDCLVISSKDIGVPETVVTAWTDHLIGANTTDESIRNNTAYVVKMLAVWQAL